VEIIVNGEVVATRELAADGHIEAMKFPVELKQSSWVAVRILPSVHTNPVFVEVAGKPIRASRRSAEWCEEAVKVCWNAKQNNIRPKNAMLRKSLTIRRLRFTARFVEESTLRRKLKRSRPV
jgi:hypothetical protein